MRPPRSLSRRAALGTLAASAALAAAPRAVRAQAYPSRPIRLVCPLPPGSPSDVLARVLAERLQAAWGQAVVVDNRPGATGAIGLDAVAKAAPDGYTAGIVFMSHTILPSLMAKLPYDTERDLAPVANLVWLYNVLVVPPTGPAGTLADLVRHAKANPGKLNYGSGGSGSPAHLIAEVFRQQAGLQMVHVPFKGPADAVQNLVAGQIDLMFSTTSTAIPQIKAGRLKPLVVTSPERLAALPEVPTMREAGLQGFDVKEWQGLVLPAGTPREIVSRWNAELQRAMAAPPVQERLAALGMSVAAPNAPQEFQALIGAELGRWSRLARDAGLRMD